MKTEIDFDRWCKIYSERDQMAIYLRKVCACGCCLYRLDCDENRKLSCKHSSSKWAWGGWKHSPGSSNVVAPADYDEYNITK